MNVRLKEAKPMVRRFMRTHYTDDRLAQLLDHARNGKLAYDSCCCFIGIVTSNHDPAEMNIAGWHYLDAKQLAGAREAESAFWLLASTDLICDETSAIADASRRRVLIPMIKAEIRRRRTTKSLIESAALEESLSPAGR